MKILTPNGKLVSISINGGENKLKMTLDIEGQGFFMPDGTIPSSQE
jgi:phosphatidate phosphatase PAH1